MMQPHEQNLPDLIKDFAVACRFHGQLDVANDAFTSEQQAKILQRCGSTGQALCMWLAEQNFSIDRETLQNEINQAITAGPDQLPPQPVFGPDDD